MKQILKFLIMPLILFLLAVIYLEFGFAKFFVHFASSTYQWLYPDGAIGMFGGHYWGFITMYIVLFFILITIIIYVIIRYFNKEKIFLYSFYFCLFICLCFFLFGLYLQFWV